MSNLSSSRRDDDGASQVSSDPNPPTVAPFSPVSISHAPSANKQRSTILVHQKSPLLIATPPQITRALAYSHPFILPLNKAAGLLTWTSGDPWESFLLLVAFWAIVLYGDVVMRWAGPIVIVVGLILGMYSRRYSPLSSSTLTGEKQGKKQRKPDSESTSMKHQKTLDEIVETLKIFTSRCNVLLEPLLQLTDFLSTQQTATSATTKPALTTLFIRILLLQPIWVLLTFAPINVITTKRMVLVAGTLFLTWHSRPNRVSRAILWRSALVRQTYSIITGLNLTESSAYSKSSMLDSAKINAARHASHQDNESIASSTASKRRPDAPGVRFTFIMYENQRRWLGIGWTTSLFAYERAAWTDEHINPLPSKDDFELPDVESGEARWRWLEGSRWLVEGAGEYDEGGTNAKEDSTAHGGQGWIYYDNKWQNGRRGQDGWGRYCRRRKWYRDAELVEITASTEITPSPTPTRSHSAEAAGSKSTDTPPPEYAESIKSDKASSVRSGFKAGSLRRRASPRPSVHHHSDDDDQPLRGEADWGIGDDARMSLE